ncbi:hypothetical protein DMC30DRAFT_393941 [Rhodotorula diobovata]|uniref:Uncharacterized protein n=1 Tax=Rhodotorula diobovata TaxID=5288 RepID=A0A5C5FYT3_9BASI|nr:hypothetical protein DMC30DRAFT_393941 [Rhodotorula diobovata]
MVTRNGRRKAREPSASSPTPPRSRHRQRAQTATLRRRERESAAASEIRARARHEVKIPRTRCAQTHRGEKSSSRSCTTPGRERDSCLCVHRCQLTNGGKSAAAAQNRRASGAASACGRTRVAPHAASWPKRLTRSALSRPPSPLVPTPAPAEPSWPSMSRAARPVKGGALGLTRERRKRSPAAVPRRCQDEDDVSRASDSAVEGRSGTRRGTGTAESARGHKRGGSRQRQRPLVRVGVIRALLSLVLTV